MKINILLLLSICTASAFVQSSVKSKPVGETTTTTCLEASRVGRDRRAFLSGFASAAVVAFTAETMGVNTPSAIFRANAVEGVDYSAVAADIAALIKADPDKGPTLVRLAWHSSGTYDKMSKTGGSALGTMRFKEEFSHGANAGLPSTAIAWMDDIKSKYGDGLSYADLYTLAGVVAVKSLGGPDVKWGFGRVDSMDPADVTPDGRLPAADSGPPGADRSDAVHLREIFGRMGFNDQEIVALSGAHALGRCHTTASGFDGPWTPTPTFFNNAYFTLLSNLDWKERKWDGPFQYEDKGKSLMMLPTDLVLLQDAKFNKYVQAYAKDDGLFRKDFAAAFAKLLSLGTKGLTTVSV